MSLCICCRVETNKYKCPRCLEPYCSLKCYKEHGLAGCEQQTSLQGVTNHTAAVHQEEPTLHEPFRTEDTVPHEQLLQLRNSDQLRNLLYNPHLRKLLHEIDVAPSAWQAMRAAMQEPLFVEFADACLQVVEPMSEAEQQQQQLLLS